MPLCHFLLEALPSKNRGPSPGSLPSCWTPHDYFRAGCLDKWCRRQETGLDPLASFLSCLAEHVYAGPIGVCGTFWGDPLWPSPLGTVPEPGWLPFVLRPTTGCKLQTCPLVTPFQPALEFSHRFSSICKERWRSLWICRWTALGLGLICWAGDRVGSGMWAFGSPEDSDVGGPQQAFPVSTPTPHLQRSAFSPPDPQSTILLSLLPRDQSSVVTSHLALDVWLMFLWH